MAEKRFTHETIRSFGAHLREEEKSLLTMEKYIRDVRAFSAFMGGEAVTRESVMAYKEHLVASGYSPGSINSMLASLNSFFRFLGWEGLKVRNMRVQKKAYCSPEKELTREEYIRLVRAAGKDTRLSLILETICSTGIRISELRYFTVEAVKKGEVTVTCKSKTRTILIPGRLRKMLLRYARRKGIGSGAVFCSKNGIPLNRSNIWAQMKRLSKRAKVASSKVFPHNLRRLFARTFHRAERDIARLADVLGHSSIDTTRIYLMSTGAEHRQRIESLNLIL